MHCSCYKEAPKNACLKCIQIIFYKKKKRFLRMTSSL